MVSKTFHPRSRHNNGYDFVQLVKSYPLLKPYVFKNAFNNDSIDFSDSDAVKIFNAALLKYDYRIDNWSIPAQYLCPPIPGRADYLHYLADLLAKDNKNTVPKGKQISGLDIGVGANTIYPILGHQIYQWRFVGSDIDPVAIQSAQAIVRSNPSLSKVIKCRLQKDRKAIFNGVIKETDRFDFTLCNPPFHASQQEADKGSQRKKQNLALNRQKKGLVIPTKQSTLNFGGQAGELWCDGGELVFLRNMITESVEYREQCLWFTSLVSKKDNISLLKKHLKQFPVKDVQVISMNQGQKVTRILAWSFWDETERQAWFAPVIEQA